MKKIKSEEEEKKTREFLKQNKEENFIRKKNKF